MRGSFSPSVNIIRDAKKEIPYVVTPNAERAFHQISDSYKKGTHAFTLIGSYGTGKSAFLWALQQSLKGNNSLFKQAGQFPSGPVRVINIVGTYQSLVEHFEDLLEVKNNLKGNQRIFDALYQEYEKVKAKKGILLVLIDEFGKFLEYAAQHDPDRSFYFIQQLAEFVNDENRDILLITTLHQNFEAYTRTTLTEAQVQEWRKVSGRLREITFNEPVEQLLILASEVLSKKYHRNRPSNIIQKLEEKHGLLSVDIGLVKEYSNSVYPLDFISAYVLTKALIRYGQNERSLFSFLQTESLSKDKPFSLVDVYDYLFNEFYSHLSSRANQDYTAWAIIRDSIQRSETQVRDSHLCLSIIKTVGLLKLLGSKAARIDRSFIEQYLVSSGEKGNVRAALDELEDLQIIYFTKFNQSYKLFEGTDVNIEEELNQAGREVSENIDVVKKIKDEIDFPFISAKAISFELGTPRFFKIEISDSLQELLPTGEVDGYVFLILNESVKFEQLQEHSLKCDEAVLFGYFTNARKIKSSVYDIEKTQVVLSKNSDDTVARRELNNILRSQRQLLSHFVQDSFYSGEISWIYKGRGCVIKSRAELNRQLSKISKDVYKKTPLFRNELINKNSISGPIHGARKDFFAALVKFFDKKNLGFDDSVFPPEKTIYITLLKETGIHVKKADLWEFVESVNEGSPFFNLWNASNEFLKLCKSERRPVSDLFELLSSKPFKMKQGFLEFWIPSFLFARRDEFALFSDQGYVPELNESILYLINRNTKEFSIKAFDVQGIKVDLYRRYREFLNLDQTRKVSNNAFIESIRPFLVLYKQLPEYTKKTSRLDQESLAVRKAIENAQDPEKVFFEDFPSALGTDIKSLSNSDEQLEEYIANLQEAIRGLRTALDNLLDRIELFITSELIGDDKLRFPSYRNVLRARYSNLKEHQLIPRQKAFLSRINSGFDDRKSWLASVVHSVLNKSIESLRDEDEELLKDRMMFLIKELDNLCSIAQYSNGDILAETIKVDVTTSEGLTSSTVNVPAGKYEDVEHQVDKFRQQLTRDRRLNIAILTKLLKEQTTDE